MAKLLRRGSSEKYQEHKRACAQRKRLKKIKAVEYKGSICNRCQESFDPCVFDFHHLDPNTKEARASILFNRSWERIKLELDKCILLCSNCHRLEHYEREPD